MTHPLVNATHIEIDKQDLNQAKITAETLDVESLKPGHVVLAVQGFGFSANNITYAVLGERMGYWGFFPATQGYGRIPVWGFATVEASRHPDVAVGRRIYGYFPMSTHLVVHADKVSASGFVDVAEQRKSIAPAYDFYTFCDTDPGYVLDREAWQANFRPLFVTSFLLDDFVASSLTDQPTTIYLTSASSKTAYGTAFLLSRQREQRQLPYRVVGLTSPGNLEFTQTLGCYDVVLSYPQAQAMQSQGKARILDFAGNKSLLLSLQAQLSDDLEQCLFIGVTDVASLAKQKDGEVKGEMFFAPAQYKKRASDWGTDVLMQKFGMAWIQLAAHLQGNMTVKNVSGTEDIVRLYQRALSGKMDNQTLPFVSF